MNSININKIKANRRLLVAPLDWGLGHASRCVPIIKALVAEDFDVIIAAENATANLLQKEFESIKIIPLAGYNIQYSKTKVGFWWKMLVQIPKIISAIKKENQWLQKIITEEKIDIVLSDNRYGLYSRNVQSIFITHQLNIQTGNSFTNKIIQKINYKYINKFDACWVVDNEGQDNLAGVLSHPKKKPALPVHYIGTISRLQKLGVEKNIDVAVILSGPEPQRTIFENIILQQLANTRLKVALVRGLPLATERIYIENFGG